jgi:hypothetical protein
LRERERADALTERRSVSRVFAHAEGCALTMFPSTPHRRHLDE